MSKFYPLGHNEWLDACKQLTPSEKDVLYYIRTLDPYSKGIKINASEIGDRLGVNRSTVSRALKTLDVKGFIDLEILMANVVIKSGGVLRERNSVAATQQNDVATPQQMLRGDRTCCVAITPVAATQHDTLKSGSGQASVFSKISLDQLDHLDRSDQDNFLNFENTEAALRADNLPPTKSTTQKIDDSSLDQNDGPTNMPTDSTTPVEGDLFRSRVKDFILKSLKFSPRDRTAYFSRFTAENWQGWEAKYKATLTQPSSMYKPFVPEQVEVASPNSPTVQDAIAEIRKSLGIKK